MDYSMFYANDETATGLVILEAKSIGNDHCIRKKELHENAAIHRIVSDSRGFCFLRIDNDPKWCLNETYTNVRLIIRNAAMSLPEDSG
ncbi:hypothetical protein ASPSYDRAFT_90125 [Aspergillus sydowii CBS 593.65]|uniref:Uncharacterized protein n=1 Tax=Aspergillus sydowii CBS 593.65 TaxID=1036612 RepID=A0A1L9TES0_9EURO|nr:uncharacterized protein ASPSYDRAFT_90125 [Aspergillus sydowii CBS 593.65]OJJ57930.1 hypothetical protein ASPSYDRAFT_90125 [Aspergillus sydowii CBS 593.65]